MIDLAIAAIKNSPPSAYSEGYHARFLKLNENWGLKVYDNRGIRDKTYRLQKMAAEINRAPQLGQNFELVVGDRILYGYITEVVEVHSELNEYGYYPDLDEFEDEEYNLLIKELCKIMEVCDLHGGNVGYLKNGTLVAFDFSLCDELG
jgi:acetyltransferase-like isoleucine patch superfamily enzyme